MFNLKKNKKEKLKRAVAIVCAALVLLAFISSIMLQPAMAVSKTELNEAKDKTAEAKKDLEEAERKKEAIVAEYNAIDKQISDAEYEISVLEAEIEQTKSEIKVLEEAIVLAQKEYDDYLEVFKTRARAMYENTDFDYLEILFSAENFSDFLAKIDIVTSIINYDQDILETIQEKKQQIIDSKASLEENLKQQEENVKILEENKKNLSVTLETKAAFMAEIMADVEMYKAVYEAADRAEQALISQASDALSSKGNPIKYTGGKFAWPVPSTKSISSYYGYRIHPIYKTRKFHSGIDINASYGVDIVAAADGTVTMSTYNGGYGKCIIVNHGSGISTLYGHNSSLLVSKGDKVKKGQLIAKAGSTGLSTGPHLHYEVRINGATVDPLSYYK